MPANVVARRPRTRAEQFRRQLAQQNTRILLDHRTGAPLTGTAALPDEPVIRLERPGDLLRTASRRHDTEQAACLVVPLSDLDRVIDAQLDLCGTWEAKALRGQGALVCSILVHHQLQLQRAQDPPGQRRTPRLVLDLRIPGGGTHHAGRQLLLPDTNLQLHAEAAESFARAIPSPPPRPLPLPQARHLHACLVWAGALPAL
ncbi:hypothetical protein [Streptomyces sp. NPDC047046]|uniref:hypothetical protein n=1 Tax=Streptomyces sp. NPDC047046 TaxID=3155378 RepID=UPI0034097F0A